MSLLLVMSSVISHACLSNQCHHLDSAAIARFLSRWLFQQACCCMSCFYLVRLLAFIKTYVCNCCFSEISETTTWLCVFHRFGKHKQKQQQPAITNMGNQPAQARRETDQAKYERLVGDHVIEFPYMTFIILSDIVSVRNLADGLGLTPLQQTILEAIWVTAQQKRSNYMLTPSYIFFHFLILFDLFDL